MTGTIRFAFGLQGAVSAAMALLIAVYLTKFYVDVVALPAGVMALAIAAGRAFDAITDPLMGWLSDRTRSRFGRRMPYIAIGVLGNTAMFVLLLNPPEQLPDVGLACWAVAALLLSFLFLTISAVPRQALAMELTQDQGHRQDLFAAIAGFVAIGTIVGAVMPNVLAGMGIEDGREQMFWQSMIYGGAYLAANIVFLLVIREPRIDAARGRTPLVPGVRRALRNRAFRITFVSHVITAIPFAIPATMLPFYTQHVLKAEDVWVGYFLLAYLLSGLMALPIWLIVAHAKGKRVVWLSASAIAVVGGAALFFAGPGDERLVLFIHMMVGLQSAVWLFVGGAMHADVVDYDELLTGKRREAQFAALWSIIPKFALIPGASIPLAVLGSVGYVPDAPAQSADVVFTIKTMHALLPATLNAIGLGLMWWYPLSEARHAAVQRAVQAQAQGKAVVDPVTGTTLPPPQSRAVSDDVAWQLDYFSPNELAHMAEGGWRRVSAALATRIAAWGVLSVALLASVVPQLGALDQDPGALPALTIVLAGLTLTASLFHAARAPALWRMRRAPMSPTTVLAHLESVAPQAPATMRLRVASVVQ
ncbi:MFS transporter [Algiphilus sp.]|uniref:MFS transporter n=1 Tax=Algiphilus sp. TaxID=1872431 RepID=UPI003BAD0EFC